LRRFGFNKRAGKMQKRIEFKNALRVNSQWPCANYGRQLG
jgi:hypothetical protein